MNDALMYAARIQAQRAYVEAYWAERPFTQLSRDRCQRGSIPWYWGPPHFNRSPFL